MPVSFNYTLTQFTPGEAERITGLTTVMQRDWRRRQFLPNEEGHARFDVFGLSEMFFMKQMSDRGIGPQHASQIADLAGGAIAYGALQEEAAYEGDPITGFGEVVDHAGSVVRKTTRRKVLRRIMPARFLIIWADGKETWHFDVQAAIQQIEGEDNVETKIGGPITVLDQTTAGRILFQRAGRPLVHVERVGGDAE